MESKTTKILLVDDHTLVLEGMRALLERIPNIQIAGTAGNAFDAIALLKKMVVDIAFVDINLPDISGIELCSKIRKEFPHTQVIALSTFKQRSYVTQMIGNGAAGYLIKSADRGEIETAIQSVLAGKMYFSNEIGNSTETINENDPPTLTKREKEIMKLIAEGKTSNEIAGKLFLSTYTVDTHRKNLLTKFEVNNTALLITMAAKYGIV
jgi:two-component system, NarL family, nitrate/nitrite response regulator NarL